MTSNDCLNKSKPNIKIYPKAFSFEKNHSFQISARPDIIKNASFDLSDVLRLSNAKVYKTGIEEDLKIKRQAHTTKSKPILKNYGCNDTSNKIKKTDARTTVTFDTKNIPPIQNGKEENVQLKSDNILTNEQHHNDKDFDKHNGNSRDINKKIDFLQCYQKIKKVVDNNPELKHLATDFQRLFDEFYRKQKNEKNLQNEINTLKNELGVQVNKINSSLRLNAEQLQLINGLKDQIKTLKEHLEKARQKEHIADKIILRFEKKIQGLESEIDVLRSKVMYLQLKHKINDGMQNEKRSISPGPENKKETDIENA